MKKTPFIPQEHVVVLMAADEMENSNMSVILKDPKWAQRVIYMIGSALKDSDLKRCRMFQAEACFILAPRYIEDRSKAVSSSNGFEDLCLIFMHFGVNR